MVKIKRNGKHSIHMIFDVNGVHHLSEAFQSALDGKQVKIRLEETTNFSNKKIKELIISCNNEQDLLSYAESSLFLQLEDEVIEYILDRLKKCIVSDDFYPAELSEVTFGEKDVTIYGFLEK